MGYARPSFGTTTAGCPSRAIRRRGFASVRSTAAQLRATISSSCVKLADQALEGEAVPSTPEQASPPGQRCTRGSGEVYWYMSNMYEFDVELARQLAGDGREPVEVDEESVRQSVDDCIIDEEHVGHVDPSIPGIIIAVFHRQPDGETVEGQLLVDGHHRAARCLRDALPYFAYLLSEEESRQIVLRTPERPGNRYHITLPGDEEDDDVAPEADDLHEPTTLDYEARFAGSRTWSQRAGETLAGGVTQDRPEGGPFEVYVSRA